jgi:hypothetical protein
MTKIDYHCEIVRKVFAGVSGGVIVFYAEQRSAFFSGTGRGRKRSCPSKGGIAMIEPIHKITCDWCGKFELSTSRTVPREFFLVSIGHAPSEDESLQEVESTAVEEVLLCTACRNAIESVKNLRMKERRENNRSQLANFAWSAEEPRYSARDRACA